MKEMLPKTFYAHVQSMSHLVIILERFAYWRTFVWFSKVCFRKGKKISLENCAGTIHTFCRPLKITTVNTNICDGDRTWLVIEILSDVLSLEKWQVQVSICELLILTF